MLFNSFDFIVFAPIALLGAALLRGAALRVWLVVMSYIFYGWGQPVYCLLLLASTVLDYLVGRGLGATDDPGRRRMLLGVSLVGNLGMLAGFKYLGFFTVTLNGLAEMAGLPVALPVPEVDLPVGISFYTFQTLSYSIDVYRRKMAPESRFSVMALYVAFFPQLVAGPIERADRLMHQLAERRSRHIDDVLAGLTRILWGLTKKIVFADWLAAYADSIFSTPRGATSWDLLLATYAFAFQIYLDFSAYSDIAIGLSRTMGVGLEENFRWPYLARNVSEFWRRWHISLSTWLRDYLYIPLGGSRRGAGRTLGNVVMVMFLGGLWHGADWKFVVWGVYIGLALVAYHLWSTWRGTRTDEHTPFRWRQAPAILLTFHVVLVSWVFFRADSMSDAMLIFGRWFTEPWGPPASRWPAVDVVRPMVVLAVAMLIHVIRGTGVTGPLTRVRQPAAVGVLWGLLVVVIALCYAPVGSRFIYFQF